MNFLRKFIGATPIDEIALIPSGKLFLTRAPFLPKGALECLYNDALIKIKKTTREHYYQLSVIKASQEGELNLESADDENDEDSSEDSSEESGNGDEKVFSIDPSLKFNIYTKSDGSQAISWKDINGDIGDRFEFAIDEDVKYTEVDNFALSLYKCLYEHRYQKSAAGITDIDQLSEFVYDPNTDDEVEEMDKLSRFAMSCANSQDHTL